MERGAAALAVGPLLATALRLTVLGALTPRSGASTPETILPCPSRRVQITEAPTALDGSRAPRALAEGDAVIVTPALNTDMISQKAAAVLSDLLRGGAQLLDGREERGSVVLGLVPRPSHSHAEGRPPGIRQTRELLTEPTGSPPVQRGGLFAADSM